MTQQKLASLLGASRSSISMWESGENQPDNDTLLKLANIFNVSVDYLLGRETFGSRLQADESPLTGKELALISAYRNNPAMQGAVDKLLGIPAEPTNNIADDVVSELNTPLFVQK